VSRYIHLNPIEANMVKYPEEYPWSSYFAYISDYTNPHITTTKILGGAWYLFLLELILLPLVPPVCPKKEESV
jgi:hypothetical protein